MHRKPWLFWLPLLVTLALACAMPQIVWPTPPGEEHPTRIQTYCRLKMEWADYSAMTSHHQGNLLTPEFFCSKMVPVPG
jgi:hypothetical protein